MDFVRFGRIGVLVAGIGISAAWYNFLVGDTGAVILGTFVGVIGILLTLTAAVKE